MKKVFEHREFHRVGHLESILKSEGIACEVRNEMVNSAWGVSGFGMSPQLWILEDRDEPRARELIENFTSREDPPRRPDWTCPNCGESVDGHFAECWNCGRPASRA